MLKEIKTEARNVIKSNEPGRLGGKEWKRGTYIWVVSKTKQKNKAMYCHEIKTWRLIRMKTQNSRNSLKINSQQNARCTINL
jgi:hypothetical protein